MKVFSLIVALLCITSAYSQTTSLYDQLCHLNGEWVKKSPSAALLHSGTYPECDSRLIQKHLTLVETSLRKNTPSGLTEQQLENRQKCLDILYTYHQNGTFPINLYHTERTPYFIDHLGTACAVGHLIIETGFPEIAQKIHNENNYGYVHDLVKKYPEILQWANEYGFTENELAWIQPTYGGGCSMSGSGMIIYASCSSSCDGVVVLPDPALTPPYTISGPSCSQLCPGNYSWVFYDGGGNSMTYTATIGSMYTVSYYLTPSDCTAPGGCDGSITATPTSGTPPFVYTLFDSTMTPISSGADSIFTALCSGEYYVSVTDAMGCTENPASSTVTEPGLGIRNTSSNTYLLYPNPAHDQLIIEGTITSITIWSMDGKKVLDQSFGNTRRATLDISSLEKGTYLVSGGDGMQISNSVFVVE